MSGTNYLLYIKIAVMYVSFYFQSMSKESLHEATSDQAPVAPPRARRVCHFVVTSVAYHLALPYTKILEFFTQNSPFDLSAEHEPRVIVG